MYNTRYFINTNESSLSHIREVAANSEGAVTFDVNSEQKLYCNVSNVGKDGVNFIGHIVELSAGKITQHYAANVATTVVVDADDSRKIVSALLANEAHVLEIKIEKVSVNVFYVDICKHAAIMSK